jgi:antitoxin component HigA of HigAB toxin-antitoxin module
MKLNPSESDIAFVRIDSSVVISGIAKQAEEWVEEYGRILNIIALREMEKFEEEMREFSKALAEIPDNLQKLKSLLSTINLIKSSLMDNELRVVDIQEKYRTLGLYRVKILKQQVRFFAMFFMYVFHLCLSRFLSMYCVM